jgi:Protein of unknown function (DUF3108)
MARWLKPLLICAALALAAHFAVLHYMGEQWLARTSALNPVANPMWTRQITQAVDAAIPTNAVAPSVLAIKPLRPQLKQAQAAIDTIAPIKPEEATQTLAITPTPTVALIETSTLTATAVVAATPTNSIAASVTTTVATTTSSTAAAPTLTIAMSAGDWPDDTRLTYKLGGYMRGELFGKAIVQWTRDEQDIEKYQVRIAIDLGLVDASFTSQGRISAAGLLPQTYEEQLPNTRRSLKVEGSEVVLMNGQRLPRPDDVQDTASQFVELGHRFSTGRAQLEAGRTASVWLARPGGLDEWVYDIQTPETLYLPLIGPVQAFHLKPRALARPRGTITAEMWFAPSLQYLPVRIRINLNADTYVDLALEKIEQR